MKNAILCSLLSILVFAFTSCELYEGVRQSNKSEPVATQPCDQSKNIKKWEPWKAEVCRIQCVQVKICGDDPDEGLTNPGYGYALSLWLKGYTPCRAAEAIIARRKSQPK